LQTADALVGEADALAHDALQRHDAGAWDAAARAALAAARASFALHDAATGSRLVEPALNEADAEMQEAQDLLTRARSLLRGSTA
jgi:hypothetical protein